jgi:hypothetical protein
LRFSDYVVLGRHLPFSNLEIGPLPVPAALVYGSYGIAVALVGAYAVRQLRLALTGRKALPLPAQLTFATALLTYNAAYLLVSDLYALLVIATAVHTLQYHVISVARNSGRLAEVRRPEGLLRLWQPKLLPVYFGLLFALGALMASSDLVLFGIIPASIVLHHFYMDGFLWKSSRNPRLASQLGIASAGSR